jgi:hypothetical protein
MVSLERTDFKFIVLFYHFPAALSRSKNSTHTFFVHFFTGRVRSTTALKKFMREESRGNYAAGSHYSLHAIPPLPHQKKSSILQKKHKLKQKNPASSHANSQTTKRFAHFPLSPPHAFTYFLAKAQAVSPPNHRLYGRLLSCPHFIRIELFRMIK